MQRHYIVKMIGNVSDWLSYAGGALTKVADSTGSTVPTMPFSYQVWYSRSVFPADILSDRSVV